MGQGCTGGEGAVGSKRSVVGRAAVGTLVETFPGAFAFINRKPLKLGIHDDLLARGIAMDVIKPGLGAYCGGGRYLRWLQAGSTRIDLDGNPAGVVTAQDAEHAVKKLAELAAREEKKAAGRKQAEEQAKAAVAKKAQVAAQPQSKGKQEPRKDPAPHLRLAQRSPGSRR